MLLHCKVGSLRRFIDRRVLFVGNASGSTCADSTVCSSVHTLALQWTSADSKRFCGGKKQQQQCHRYCEEAEQSEVWSTMSGNAAAVSVVLLPPLLFPPWPHHLPAPSENTAAVAEASDRLHWPLCMCMCALLFHCECTCSGSRPAKHHPANRSRLFPAQRDTQLLLLLLYLSAAEIDKPRSVDDALVQLLPLLLPLLKPGRELVTDTTLSLVLRAVKQDTGTETERH